MNKIEKLGLIVICVAIHNMPLQVIEWSDFIVLLFFLAGAALFMFGDNA